jgi:hypothetical protein
VATKAFGGAKSFGSFLYTAVNKAGKTVSEASAKIKKTVEENVSYFLYLVFYFQLRKTINFRLGGLSVKGVMYI